MAPGNRSQSRVLPSTSVNKKVKVPDAGSACTALASQHHLGFSECP
jgi:hypothetical protein